MLKTVISAISAIIIIITTVIQHQNVTVQHNDKIIFFRRSVLSAVGHLGCVAATPCVQRFGTMLALLPQVVPRCRL